MRAYPLYAALAAMTLLPTACSKVTLPTVSEVAASLPALVAAVPPEAPAMRWDHRPEAAEWTARTLAALQKHDAVLASAVPADIEGWCPAYATAAMPERRAFWAGLLSAVAKYESSWNPQASGGGGKYIGIMQISPKSAANYGCAATSSKSLKNGGANLECAVDMLAYQVARDQVVAGKGSKGIGRDWMPLRKSDKRSEMRAWTSAQSYCQ